MLYVAIIGDINLKINSLTIFLEFLKYYFFSKNLYNNQSDLEVPKTSLFEIPCPIIYHNLRWILCCFYSVREVKRKVKTAGGATYLIL
ncbi:hypothetical protein APB85_11905 [Salegentibacter mishustinae]|nr:hypothetical protein APB85_11905 [Salegentibacter mishustinae]